MPLIYKDIGLKCFSLPVMDPGLGTKVQLPLPGQAGTESAQDGAGDASKLEYAAPRP